MKHIFHALTLASMLTLTARAALVSVTPSSPIEIPTTFEGVYLDFGGDLSSVDTYTSSPGSYDVNFFFSGLGILNDSSIQFVRTEVGGPVANLAGDLTVDSTSVYDSALLVSGGYIGDPFAHVGDGAEQFGVGEIGYLGFAYDPYDTGTPIYGYMQVIFQDAMLPGSILGWVYESTAGTGIVSVPESSTYLGMASMLGLGLFILHRRRARKCLAER
ncbi:PEP-CTERM sorting domain-containing protein [Cerasicoccus frondis]|uniref:PEP-CTERM sorting domain-containing protein n=1 Tax=Cerasicoccus frondis TaxID=490090 RepID=UPI002852C9D9|nr:PEP-CTERM sorting domain-containing protein [Cerasicoccus frondis]